jgi:hypothetical protein
MWNASKAFPILMKPKFFRLIFEKSSYIKFQEIRSVGAELFHADRRTDVTKLIVSFRNFAKSVYKRLQCVCKVSPS